MLAPGRIRRSSAQHQQHLHYRTVRHRPPPAPPGVKPLPPSHPPANTTRSGPHHQTRPECPAPTSGNKHHTTNHTHRPLTARPREAASAPGRTCQTLSNYCHQAHQRKPSSTLQHLHQQKHPQNPTPASGSSRERQHQPRPAPRQEQSPPKAANQPKHNNGQTAAANNTHTKRPPTHTPTSAHTTRAPSTPSHTTATTASSTRTNTSIPRGTATQTEATPPLPLSARWQHPPNGAPADRDRQHRHKERQAQQPLNRNSVQHPHPRTRRHTPPQLYCQLTGLYCACT